MRGAASPTDAEKIREIRDEIEQKIEDMSVTYPEDITLWDYDAVRDYVNALEVVIALTDVDAEILNSVVLTPDQIESVGDLITKRLVELETEHA